RPNRHENCLGGGSDQHVVTPDRMVKHSNHLAPRVMPRAVLFVAVPTKFVATVAACHVRAPMVLLNENVALGTTLDAVRRSSTAQPPNLESNSVWKSNAPARIEGRVDSMAMDADGRVAHLACHS